TGHLIDKNMIKYDKGGQLVLYNGAELPRLVGHVSSVAQAIRDRNATALGSLKGKGQADFCNQLPHLASVNFAGLQFDGKDVLNRDVLGVATVSAVPAWHLFATPVTWSGKETSCFDPINKLSAKKSHEPSLPSPPPIVSDQHLPPSKPPMPGSSTLPVAPRSEIPKPPTVNTHEGVKRKGIKNDKMDVDEDKQAKYDSYHFVSTIQKMFDPDVMMDHLLRTTTTVMIGLLIGGSPVLQKCFNNITRLRCEYTNKPVIAHFAETFDPDAGPCKCDLNKASYAHAAISDPNLPCAQRTEYANS
ncbi:hypothetical protein H0H87_010813, partial [Tephrocybe sp. NHM501043]